MITLILVLIFAVVIIGVWNVHEIRQLSQKPLRINEINDKHYWELKYKLQYLLAVFTLITAIAAYFGITTLSDVEEKIKAEFKPTIDSLRNSSEGLRADFDRLNKSAEARSTDLKVAEKAIRGLGAQNETLNRALQLSRSSLTHLKDNIELLNNNNKNRVITYIVESVEIGDMKQNGDWPKIYFKDLRQPNGDPLPLFSSKPIVFVASMDGTDASIRNVTSESFEILTMMSTKENPPYLFTVFITERPFK